MLVSKLGSEIGPYQREFFWSGIVPCYANDGDVLRLQYVAIELDLGLVQVVGPSGRALLDYVAAERTRVAAGP